MQNLANLYTYIKVLNNKTEPYDLLIVFNLHRNRDVPTGVIIPLT